MTQEQELRAIAEHLASTLREHKLFTKVIETINSVLIEISMSVYGMDSWTRQIANICIYDSSIKISLTAHKGMIVDLADPDAFDKTIHCVLDHRSTKT